MPARVLRLRAAAAERQKLVDHVDERHRGAAVAASIAAAELLPDDGFVEAQGFIDVPDLEGGVVQADQPWLPRAHQIQASVDTGTRQLAPGLHRCRRSFQNDQPFSNATG
ncbi:hypothetical protein [Methylopila jiangsuensis]|uniref:hypothetical protein n=1 Tax=Methylopila jiangsuensis TaxID=586230 RepID=UPI0022F2BD40|nr:hypothetical protein [Methylopila jiangsuensis]